MSKVIEKPWGWEEIWANTEDYVGKIIFINAGQRLSKQYHEKKEETVYVLEGTLMNIDQEGNCMLFQPGESFHVRPHQVHRFCATEDGPVKIVEVSTNHLSDVIRLDDDYGR